MSVLSREECIELGVSTPTSILIEWAGKQISATQGHESRLQIRGVGSATLADIRELAVVIEGRQRELGDSHGLPPEPAALAERIRADAVGYWREAKRLVGVAFATQPDVLAKFRTGVRTGLLIANLIQELESMIPLMREHAAPLAVLGARESFVTRGELLVARLKEAKSRLDGACKELPPAVAQLYHDKGLLYHLTRNLVRVGRLEFALEPQEAARFNFNLVRRDRGVSTGPRLKKLKAVGP
jgi:hypothetical protein